MCEDYRLAVDKLFELQSKEEISNGKPEHAAAFLATIFKYSQKYVFLFCKNLAADVFEDNFLVEQVKKAHDRGVTIKILISDEAVESPQMREFLKNTPVVSINKFLGTLTPAVHFAVSDGRALRREADHNGKRAIGYANCPDRAQPFADLFSKMERMTIPVSL